MSSPKAPAGHFTLLYFAAATSYTRKEHDFFPAPMLLSQLYATVDEKYPGIKHKVLESSALTVNLDYIDAEEETAKGDAGMTIKEGDEVAIIPPLAPALVTAKRIPIEAAASESPVKAPVHPLLAATALKESGFCIRIFSRIMDRENSSHIDNSPDIAELPANKPPRPFSIEGEYIHACCGQRNRLRPCSWSCRCESHYCHKVERLCPQSQPRRHPVPWSASRHLRRRLSHARYLPSMVSKGIAILRDCWHVVSPADRSPCVDRDITAAGHRMGT